jgi:glyoxylase-like metal-dependent hydrolase (beta-lactamase superfamily II)
MGYEVKDIDTVILTHGHPDHIGGTLDTRGKPAFPNARYVMLKDEWDFWMSKPNFMHLKLGDELKQFILMSARKNLPPIQEQLVLIDHETEILPGIVAIAAPGHTPGHMALAISSGGEQLLHISDTVLYPIHMEQPDWYPAFDFAPEQASVTKHKLLNRAAAEKVMVFAFHFPFPHIPLHTAPQARYTGSAHQPQFPVNEGISFFSVRAEKSPVFNADPRSMILFASSIALSKSSSS